MGISTLPMVVLLGEIGWRFDCHNRGLASCSDAKKPPGNRVAFSLGRIVPTEARPSELSWRHSMGGLLGCQGQIIFAVSIRFYWPCCTSTIHALKPYHSPYVRHRPKFITDKSRGLLVLLWRLHHAWFNHGRRINVAPRPQAVAIPQHSPPDSAQVELDELHLFHGGRRFAPRDPIERTTTA